MLSTQTTSMIVAYIRQAVGRARYSELEDGTFSATVPGLRGVLAVGRTQAACKRELASVVEEWVLVRVARGLRVPKLGGIEVRVKRAS
ncbi:MAG: type II toxin-antitoxin system HicB family antitoxin [Planctomycetes bacterium]|nr:type II toxin-antitoxin system HicB family antitoxin [Planctomycetota bacterium]